MVCIWVKIVNLTIGWLHAGETWFAVLYVQPFYASVFVTCFDPQTSLRMFPNTATSPFDAPPGQCSWEFLFKFNLTICIFLSNIYHLSIVYEIGFHPEPRTVNFKELPISKALLLCPRSLSRETPLHCRPNQSSCWMS